LTAVLNYSVIRRAKGRLIFRPVLPTKTKCLLLPCGEVHRALIIKPFLERKVDIQTSMEPHLIGCIIGKPPSVTVFRNMGKSGGDDGVGLIK
jgi:hypothetical protein